MRLLLPVALLALAGCAKGEWEAFQARIPNAVAIMNSGTPQATPAPPMQMQPMRTFSHSYQSGLNRICIYNTPSGQTALTIGAAEICPLN